MELHLPRLLDEALRRILMDARTLVVVTFVHVPILTVVVGVQCINLLSSPIKSICYRAGSRNGCVDMWHQSLSCIELDCVELGCVELGCMDLGCIRLESDMCIAAAQTPFADTVCIEIRACSSFA